MMDFDYAFERLIGHEGLYTSSWEDRGNWSSGQIGVGELKGTKYGISAASYPDEDIVNLTVERAKEIARRDYWTKAGCEAVPEAIRFDLFDMAYNSGVRAAVRTLQTAVGSDPDGFIGPITMAAIKNMDPLRIVARFNGARLMYVANAPTWGDHGRGWVRRIATNLLES